MGDNFGNRSRCSTRKAMVPVERIQRSILLIRGQKVMLDSDLAATYGVTTKRLNEQVRRNGERFPEDFMFRLTKDEHNALRSQIATLEPGRGRFRKYLPFAFTEHGAVMLASILDSPVAIEASIRVVRAFVRLREMMVANKELAHKLDKLERKIAQHDKSIISIFEAIRQLMNSPKSKRRQIGFRIDKKE